MKRTIVGIALVLIVSAQLSAQNRTRFAGRYNASDYAYGLLGNSVPNALSVATGFTSTGSQTLTMVNPCTVLGDGTTLCPLNTNSPILVGTGTTSETVTPTAVSGCTSPSAPYASCTVTATFTYAHGTGEIVQSGSYGLQEALNAASGSGNAVVDLDNKWTQIGGTTAVIEAAAPYSGAYIEDNRIGSTQRYWTMQPSTLTVIPNTVALTTSTAVFAASPVVTWANSAYYLCYTYVDALGGESTCSPTANQTPTVNYSLTVTSPAATTGAVGWRM